MEVWKSTCQLMKSKDYENENKYEDMDQNLLLYSNGTAIFIDSLQNEKVNSTLSNWEILKKNEKEYFSFGHGNEKEGILGIVYPILQKDESVFKMKFDSILKNGDCILHT